MTDIIREYYNKNSKNEWLRLNDPYNRLELFSTMYMIKEYFPQEGKILDIGSGPGRYSIELLKRGYEVSLMDLSEKSIDMAKRNIESMGLKAKDYICGDALYLDFIKDNTFDGILLMGPMYHVQSREDRIRILENCMRILKPGGKIIIFDGNHYCYMFDERYMEERKINGHANELKNIMGVSPEEINRIAYDLPLSKKIRPEWDKSILTSLGVKIIDIDINEISYKNKKNEDVRLIKDFKIVCEI